MNIESMPRTAGRGARRLWAALLLGALAVTALGAPVAAATTT
jgi:hypothetical protein